MDLVAGCYKCHNNTQSAQSRPNSQIYTKAHEFYILIHVLYPNYIFILTFFHRGLPTFLYLQKVLRTSSLLQFSPYFYIPQYHTGLPTSIIYVEGNLSKEYV
jgi:hypothetical protein